MPWEVYRKGVRSRSAYPSMTIHKKGNITLNSAAMDLLMNGDERVQRVPIELLYDREQDLIGIRRADGCCSLIKQRKSGIYLVSGVLFCRHFGIEAGVARRYEVRMDGDILVARASGEHSLAGQGR